MNIDNSDSIKITISVDATRSDEPLDTLEFSQTATTTLDEFDSVMDAVGFYVNILLKSMGYVRENDYMFMESINEQEKDFLSEALDKYRNYIGGVK